MDIEEKRRIKKETTIQRLNNRRTSKRISTKSYAISQVKDVARRDTWCSSHENCFRYSLPPAESPAHRDKKFERHVYWRDRGASVFTELILQNGSRPDLVVCMPDGDVFIEEILESEKDENIEKKKEKYPFTIYSVRV